MPHTGNEIAMLIGNLGAADAAKRASAGTEIFERGRELAVAATREWLSDEQLRRCLVIGNSGFLEATVGLAVTPHRFENIRSASGSPPLADVPPDQDAREFEIDFPGGVRLDILTTRQPEGAGAMARFLQKFGEGIQQVELLTNNVDLATQVLHTRFGVAPVFPATRPGTGGTRVNFFLVPLPKGEKILIELVEAGTQHA
ncbi:MAG: hypothetical protein ACRD4C_13420 [Candidatus Acidiferrales bacterium]